MELARLDQVEKEVSRARDEILHDLREADARLDDTRRYRAQLREASDVLAWAKDHWKAAHFTDAVGVEDGA